MNVGLDIHDGGVNSLVMTPMMILVIVVQTIVSDDDLMMYNVIVARCLGLIMSSLHPENESTSKETEDDRASSVVYHLDYIAVIALHASVFARVVVIAVENLPCLWWYFHHVCLDVSEFATVVQEGFYRRLRRLRRGVVPASRGYLLSRIFAAAMTNMNVTKNK